MTLHALCCNLLPPCQNKVVLYATTERYGDNMRYVAEELLRRGGCEVVWVSERQKVPTPKGIRNVCGRLAMRRELATAHVIVSDARISKYWLKGYLKKPGQVYIHARYGSFGIAKEEADVHDASGASIDQNIGEDSRNLDILVSNCVWHTDSYHFNYQFSGEYLQIGTPRNDVLLNSDSSVVKRRLCRKYGIHDDTSIAVYAPARRPWAKARFSTPDYDDVLKSLRKRFGGRWVLLIRRHPLLSTRGMSWLVPRRASSIVDVWEHPDAAELLVAADVMIGDYSSYMFDYLLTGRPAFLYVPDVKDFETHVGFYDSPESTPIPSAANNATLCAAIESFDSDIFTKQVADFLCRRGNSDDGHATTRLCNVILSKVNESIPDMSLMRWRVIRDAIWHVRDINASQRQLYILGFGVRKYSVAPVNKWLTEPIKKNKIVFFVDNWMSYSGSPRSIAEEIIRRGLHYDLVWIVSPYILHFIKDVPSQIRTVITGTPDSLHEYSTAKLWIDDNLRNTYVSKWEKKREGQIRLNTWHASLDLIKEVKRRKDTLKQWNEQARYASSVDYVVSTCAWETKLRREMFPNCKRVLQFGNPRNDSLINGDHNRVRCQIFEELGIPLEKKIVLYTSARFNKLKWSGLDWESILQALERSTGTAWVFVAKNHYDAIDRNGLQQKLNSSLVEIDDFVNMPNLLVASDALISDYSPCIMDYLLLRRPTFLYIPGRQKILNSIELHYQLGDTPFPIAESNQELVTEIEKFEFSAYKNSCEEFCNKMGYREDGNATCRLVDFIKTIVPTN